jgi:hypothetical protein
MAKNARSDSEECEEFFHNKNFTNYKYLISYPFFPFLIINTKGENFIQIFPRESVTELFIKL